MNKAGTLNLYPIDVHGTGTPFVQSLTSYICAVAAAHNLSPTALLRIIGRHAGVSFDSTAWHLARTDGAIVNGYGSFQTQVLTALSRASGRPDLMQTCLGQLRPVFAAKGGRAVKINRHWCAKCYISMRSAGIVAYDLLLIQIAELQICPEHKMPLQSTCGQCGAHQLTLPANCRLDICGKCGVWLGSLPLRELGADLESAAYQEWLVHELKHLLIVRDQVAPLLTGREVRRFLRELMDARDLSAEVIATQVKIPVNTLAQWISGRNQPTIAFWLRACANLGISPAAVFLDPQIAAHQLPLPFESPTIYQSTRDGPIRKHDRDRIRKAVSDQLALNKPTVRGVIELAKVLGIPVGMMYFHDPDGCKNLTRKIRRLTSIRTAKKKETLARSAQRLLVRLDRENEKLTRKNFVERLMERSDCTVRVARDLFPIALQKYLEGCGE